MTTEDFKDALKTLKTPKTIDLDKLNEILKDFDGFFTLGTVKNDENNEIINIFVNNRNAEFLLNDILNELKLKTKINVFCISPSKAHKR